MLIHIDDRYLSGQSLPQFVTVIKARSAPAEEEA
jgi:hypothetical protein